MGRISIAVPSSQLFYESTSQLWVLLRPIRSAYSHHEHDINDEAIFASSPLNMRTWFRKLTQPSSRAYCTVVSRASAVVQFLGEERRGKIV
jgi:hypothetical protein